MDDELRKAAQDVIAQWKIGSFGMANKLENLEAALAKNANAAPSSDAEYAKLGKAMYEMTTTVHSPFIPFSEQCDLIPHVWQKFMDEANAAPQDQDAKDAALRSIPDLAWEIYDHWDNDREMKVGKCLMALAGRLKNYYPRFTAIHDAIAAMEQKP